MGYRLNMCENDDMCGNKVYIFQLYVVTDLDLDNNCNNVLQTAARRMGYRSEREGIPMQEFCGYKCGGLGNNDNEQNAWEQKRGTWVALL
jgi:hypothetical protein